MSRVIAPNRSTDQIDRNENKNGKHLKFVHASMPGVNSTKLTVWLTVKVNLFTAFSIYWLLCIHSSSFGRAIKCKRDFSSHSTNSIYSECFIGKMLSTVATAAATITVQFVLCCVVFGCWLLETKRNVRMTNLFPTFV